MGYRMRTEGALEFEMAALVSYNPRQLWGNSIYHPDKVLQLHIIKMIGQITKVGHRR